MGAQTVAVRLLLELRRYAKRTALPFNTEGEGGTMRKLTKEEWGQSALWRMTAYWLWGVIPFVRVQRGSVVLGHVYGFTEGHAWWRVIKALERNREEIK
jgi:hypothetical protein